MSRRKNRAAVLRVRRREPEPEEVLAEETGQVQVGDTVIRRPVTFGGDGERPGRAVSGRVTYVHPLGRFHVVEFGMARGETVRECFAGTGR